MPKRSADCASSIVERDAPATIRMALLTKRAKIQRLTTSSTIEYVRQDLMAAIEGMYSSFSSFVPVSESGVKVPVLISASRRRD